MRSTGLTYPNGTAISTAYTGTHAGYLSRPDQVKEGSSVIASMHCLGLGTLVGLNYDGASNLNLTYEGGTSSDAGDQYTSLDRFGRIVETIWIKGSADVVQAVYGRNRASSILWRRDDEASSTITMDAFYTYDGLQQVTAWKRGNLSPNTGPPYTGVTSKKQGEDFTYDQTGNWLGDVSDNPNFTQSRTHNKANQIASITGPSGVIQPLYDAAGNMTRSPSPAAWNTAYAYKWDAWSRLVEIKQGSTVVGAYAYDAMTRRTRKTVGGVTRDIYFDRQWRSVEEREGSTVKVQHTWSPIDRWTLIRRKRNASGSTLNETLFCLRDNLDPVAIADTSGNVEERYNYDAFGTVRIMSAAYGVRGSSSYDWNFLFHGEFIDDESGLYNYGYRYYDPVTGRWPSRDPIQEGGGVNLYSILNNDVVGAVDVLGLLEWSDFQGTPDPASQHDALTCTTLGATFEVKTKKAPKNGEQCCADGYLTKVKITRKLNRSLSWVRPGRQSNNLLNHETGHVLITKTVGERMKAELEAVNERRCAATQDLADTDAEAEAKSKGDIIVTRTTIANMNNPDGVSDLQKLHNDYDKSTNHNQVQTKQNEWDTWLQGGGRGAQPQ